MKALDYIESRMRLSHWDLGDIRFAIWWDLQED